jgi:hypothetical protein
MTMHRKDNEVFPKDGKISGGKHSSFKRVVSEDSTVILDARDLVRGSDANSIKYYSWEQTAGTPIIDGDVKDKPIFSFTAPYVNYNISDSDSSTSVNNAAIPPVYTNLSFQLTIMDNDVKTIGSPYNVELVVKRVQRAIIFQGGVALGAYEAGVFQAIVKKLIKNEEDKKGMAYITKKGLCLILLLVRLLAQ